MLMLPHVLGLFTGFIGPLIIFLVRNEDPRVRSHAAAALNWQLSLMIYLLGSTVILVVLGLVAAPVIFLLFLVFFGLLLYDLVICVVAAVKGNNGEPANYPGAIPMVRP
jgi:uncharacterized protein